MARKTQTYNQLENTPVPKDEEEKKNRELSLKKAQSSLAEAVFQAAKETVDKLRAKFGNLVAEIEVLLSELYSIRLRAGGALVDRRAHVVTPMFQVPMRDNV